MRIAPEHSTKVNWESKMLLSKLQRKLNKDNDFDMRDIEAETKANSHYRRVLFTTKYLQLVLMSLKPNEEIGMEKHDSNDQFFRFESGRAKIVVDNQEIIIKDGSSVIVPAGKLHNIINISDGPLKFYTIYAPPHHKDALLQKEKDDQQD